jgi:hypothetical protein
MRFLKIGFLGFFVFSTVNADARNDLLVNLVKVVSIPANEDYTGNDWRILAKLFPKIIWKDIESNDGFGKATNLKISESQAEISVLGARSMISQVKSNFSYPADESLVRDGMKNLANMAKLVCESGDNSSYFGEEFYRITLNGYKSIIAKVEWSYGSSGGSEYLTIGDVQLGDNCKKTETTSSVEKQPKVDLIKLGFISGALKTFDGAGCYYTLKPDKNDSNSEQIAADSYDGKGLILNINGQDTLIPGTTKNGEFFGENGQYKVKIPSGKTKSCGEECAETQTTIELISIDNRKIVNPVIQNCIS